MENILRIVGQVAGIGGLAIGLFLLVARSVLKELPKPTGFSQERYKTVIDRIILFAFILSVLGLGIYAGTKIIESAKLSQEIERLLLEKADLQRQLDSIVDQNLKSKTAAFEVLDLNLTFDLSNWKPVPLDKLSVEKLSTEITRNKRLMWRAAKEASKFTATYGTRSSFDPVFDCKEYDLKSTVNSDPITPGQDSQKRWILEYNLATAPLFEPFEINTQVTAYNALQNQETEFEGTLIAFPTRRALLKVIFPKDKLPLDARDAIWCETKPFGEKVVPTQVKNPAIHISADRTVVEWTIDEPRLNYLYLIHWKW